MNATRWAVALICALAAFFITPVRAQQGPPCYAREQVVEHLAERFGEAMTAAGVDARGNLVQVFSAPEGSWTIVVTIPGGPSCIMMAGEGWSWAEPEPVIDEAPS
ncbi:MAG: hypothetical protein HQ481_13160 [Alphaproteobacteria bacterium]|nr:hypothetical protein [Alphaproteobacteria bacterium]